MWGEGKEHSLYPEPWILLALLGGILACYRLLSSQEVYVSSVLPTSLPLQHEAEASWHFVQIWKQVTQLGRWFRQRHPIHPKVDTILLLPRFGYQSLGRILAPLALCGWASLLVFLAQGIREYNKHMHGKPFSGELPFCFQSERKPERSQFINIPLARHLLQQ